MSQLSHSLLFGKFLVYSLLSLCHKFASWYSHFLSQHVTPKREFIREKGEKVRWNAWDDCLLIHLKGVLKYDRTEVKPHSKEVLYTLIFVLRAKITERSLWQSLHTTFRGSQTKRECRISGFYSTVDPRVLKWWPSQSKEYTWSAHRICFLVQ